MTFIFSEPLLVRILTLIFILIIIIIIIIIITVTKFLDSLFYFGKDDVDNENKDYL